MSEIDFYTNPQSRGLIVHWLLEELGEPYNTHWLDYGEAMKSPQYLAVNPLGKVPAVRHGEAVVSECGAICAYLAAAFPQRGLMPTPGPALADYYRALFFAAGPLEMIATAKSMSWDIPAERSQTLGFGTRDSAFDALEAMLNDRQFVCGDQFSAADVYLGSALIWGLMFETLDARPIFQAYTERLTQRPAYVRSQSINAERQQAGA